MGLFILAPRRIPISTSEAPPCPGFSDLHGLPSLRVLASTLAAGAEDNEQISAAVSVFNLHIERFQLLIAHLTKSVGQLETTRSQLEKKKETDAAKEEAAKRAAAKAAARVKQRAEAAAVKARSRPMKSAVNVEGNILCLVLATVGTEIPAFTEGQSLEPNYFDKPMIFREVSALQQGTLFEGDRELRMQYNLFKGGFSVGQPARQSERELPQKGKPQRQNPELAQGRQQAWGVDECGNRAVSPSHRHQEAKHRPCPWPSHGGG